MPETAAQKALREFREKKASEANKSKPSKGPSTASGQVNQGNWKNSELIPYEMKDAYGPKGVQLLNGYRAKYGLPPISEKATEAEIKSAAGEMQKAAIATNPELVKDYMINKSHQPNKKLQDILPAGYPKTQAGLQKAIADGKITADDAKAAYNDDQFWYRGLITNRKKLSKEDYEKQMQVPGAVKQGDKQYWNDPTQPYIYNEYYMDEDKPQTPAAAVQTPVTPMPGAEVAQNPLIPQYYNFPDEPFVQDIMKQANARRNFYSIPDEMAWGAKASPHLMDYVLRSPERALAANTEGFNMGAQQLGTFGGRNVLSSQLSQLSGKHAANAADILSQVEGQNVGTTNQAYGVNADILNRFGMMDADQATSQYYDQLNMNRAKQSAKNKAWGEWTDAEVQGIDNQVNAYNINTLNPEYGIYGSTGGKIYRTGYDRGPIKPTQPGQDMTQAYLKLKEQLPDASEETLLMMLGLKK